jgi:hypothetical protein
MVAFGNTVIAAWVDSNLGLTGYWNSDIWCEPDWYPPSNSIPRFIGWAVSTDGGVSFSDKGSPPVFSYVADGTTNMLGDAATRSSVETRILARSICSAIHSDLRSTTRMEPNAKIYVPLRRSTNNGDSFLAPINVLPGLPAYDLSRDVGDMADKPALAVDNFPGAGAEMSTHPFDGIQI